MTFNFNKLGDTLLKIGTSTLQTGTFWATAKAFNSPCNAGSIFGCGTFGGYAGFPMGGFSMGGFPMGGYSLGGYPSMACYGQFGMMDPYSSQMAIGQAYGQGFALGEQLKAQGTANAFTSFMLPGWQNQFSLNQKLEPTQNPAAEKFENHPTELGKQFEENSKNNKSTTFVTSEWQAKAEGKEKDAEYKDFTTNFAKSYIAHMDETSGNKDNEISKEEYLKYNMAEDLTEDATEQEIASYKQIANTSFEKIDQNGDGKIDWKEMSALLSTYDNISGQRDGKITIEEMSAGFNGITNASSTDMDNKLRNEYTRLFGTTKKEE